MKSSKPLSKSFLALAFGAVVVASFAAPASAAQRHQSQTRIPAAMQAYQPNDIVKPSVQQPLREGCYYSRSQVPVVGSGLRWVDEVTCPYIGF